jgi:signal transduction histidine kinase
MQLSSTSFVERVIGAIGRDPATYEEVEHDVSTGRAVAIAVVAFLAMVVVLVIVATVFGINIASADRLTPRPS